MKRIFLIPGMIAALAMTACGGGDDSTEDTTGDAPDSTETTSEERPAIDPFPDFPLTALDANNGDVILSPSKNWQEDATKEGADNVTFIFYNQTVAEVGEKTSKVNFMGENGVEIPNYMIIPIKANQTAKKGDIVLTWWQTGSGMQRAIVVDDTDPASPTVRYLDLSWDNPATNSDGKPIAQAHYQIKPGTFHVLSADWSPGTTVAAKSEGKSVAATVVAVAGDQVLTIGFAGKMKIYAKSDCTPCPVIPNVKAGDKVQIPWVGTFKESTVERVDAALGAVWCDDPFSDEPMVVSFGDISTNLAL